MSTATSTTFSYTGTIATYTAPAAGTYKITAIGASGGTGCEGDPGGIGAKVRCDVVLTMVRHG